MESKCPDKTAHARYEFERVHFPHVRKKGKRKVQVVLQSQAAALPRQQEEEETDKPKQEQIEQRYEKH